jgi:hypothetical protein
LIRVTALLLHPAMLMAAPAVADEVALSARASSAVLVREGPPTILSFWSRCALATARLSSVEVSGWYIVELADGARGNPPASEPTQSAPWKIAAYSWMYLILKENPRVLPSLCLAHFCPVASPQRPSNLGLAFRVFNRHQRTAFFSSSFERPELPVDLENAAGAA